MIANIPSNIEAEYDVDDHALNDAFWAAKHGAKITYAEWRAWEKVKGAEAAVGRLGGPLSGHQRKLLKLFGTDCLPNLREAHGDHPVVLAAIKAAHKCAGLTPKHLDAYERMQRALHVEPVPAMHGAALERLFGTRRYVAAYRTFEAKWYARFSELQANAA